MSIIDPRVQPGDASRPILTVDTANPSRLTDQELILRIVSQRIQAAWPHLQTSTGPFVERVASLLDRSLPLTQGLEQLSVEDLYLVHACQQQDPAALVVFTQRFDAELATLGAKFRLASCDLDDIRQLLWDKLFIPGREGSGAIEKYSGKGPLWHWLKVLAARTVLDEIRKTKTQAKLSPIQDLDQAAPENDPELATLRAHYSHAFRAAFTTAVKALEPSERNILRCHYVQNMSTDQIARAFGMHKATAARHVVKARARLLEATRSELKSQLAANSGEIDSVLRLFDGELSVSLSLLLK